MISMFSDSPISSNKFRSNVAGTLIEVKFVQPKNVSSPILVRLSGRVIEVKLLQPENVPFRLHHVCGGEIAIRSRKI